MLGRVIGKYQRFREPAAPIFRMKDTSTLKWRQQVYSKRWCQSTKLQRHQIPEDLNTHALRTLCLKIKLIFVHSTSFPVTRGRIFIIDVTFVYACCSKNVSRLPRVLRMLFKVRWTGWAGRWLSRRSHEHWKDNLLCLFQSTLHE